MEAVTHPHLTRQLDIIPMEILSTPINIIGAGSIGSFTTLVLAKMGFEDITVFDDDEVSIENMNCQFYTKEDVGIPKVVTLQETIDLFTGLEIKVHRERYNGEEPLKGIVISAVDNMKSRKAIWEGHTCNAIRTKLIIDPRMGAEQALVYAMKPLSPKDQDSYAKTLYSDEDAVHERCTAKSTMYTAMMLSGYVGKIVKDFLTDAPYPRVTMWNIKDNVFKAYFST